MLALCDRRLFVCGDRENPKHGIHRTDGQGCLSRYGNMAHGGQHYLRCSRDGALTADGNNDSLCYHLEFNPKLKNLRKHFRWLIFQVRSIPASRRCEMDNWCPYQPFVETHQISTVRNCFLIPTASSDVIEKGVVSLGMLQNLGLQNIQIRLLPASTMCKHYIDNTKFNLQSLNL